MHITLSGFGGASKAPHPHLLPDHIGVESLNQHPGRGDLRPWKTPLTVASVPSGRKTIYRYGRDVFSASQYWFSFNTIVHLVRGFIASDTTERTYATGVGAPKVYDNTISIASAPYPTAARDLGVPRPDSAFLIAASGTVGSGDDQNRFYVQTWVTDRGEESAPGPAVAFTCKPGAVLNITSIPAPPAGNHGITLTRLYHTVPTSEGQGEFFLFREIASSATSTTDPGTALGADVLVTNGWFVPPSDLKCLTGLWNGMMAGISGRSVRFCEPFHPYAWPIAYEIIPPDVTPVAIGVWAQNALLLTTGKPRLLTGPSPDAMSDEGLEFEQACVSVQSVAPCGLGVAWAAPDGLAYYGSDGPKLLTSKALTREDWQAMKPETIVGCGYEGAYVGFYNPSGSTWKGFIVHPAAPDGIYFLETGYPAAFFDKIADALFVLDGTNVKQWDAGAAFMTAKFVSKVHRLPQPGNLSHMKVTASQYPVTVKVTAKWVDRQGNPQSVVEDREVTNPQPVTLRGGFVADEYQFEVSTTGAVQGVAFADSSRELAAL